MWMRTCQECFHQQSAKQPVPGDVTDSYAYSKCRKCKSESLDYGKEVDAIPHNEDETPEPATKRKNPMPRPVRKSSGCVVFRVDAAARDIQLLLVTSTSAKKWFFPKGGVEADLTPLANARKETYEEAGVQGAITGKLGTYRYVKDGVMQEVTMYGMEFAGETNDWPEQHLRERMWFSVELALKELPPLLAPFVFDVLELLDD